MDKRKDVQALDDEALDGVSGGIELTPMVRSFGKKKQNGKMNNDLTYRGEKVQMGGLVLASEFFHPVEVALPAEQIFGREVSEGAPVVGPPPQDILLVLFARFGLGDRLDSLARCDLLNRLTRLDGLVARHNRRVVDARAIAGGALSERARRAQDG